MKIKNDFLSTYLAELAIWPAYQAFNFSKVPVRHQLLFVNAGCLIDATFLCWYLFTPDTASYNLKRPAEVSLADCWPNLFTLDRTHNQLL